MKIEEALADCEIVGDWLETRSGDFVRAYKGQKAELDGDFTSAQLRALADWLDSD